MIKHCALKKNILHSEWQLMELGDWTRQEDGLTIPPWLAPLGPYRARKIREQVEKILKWLIDCNNKNIYDIVYRRIVVTFATNIVHHSWKEVSDNKKELVVVLYNGRLYFLDLHLC